MYAGTNDTVDVFVNPTETGFCLERMGGWESGKYQLVVEPFLEDLAGNSIARPLNLDLEEAGRGVAEPGPVSVPFRIP